MDMAHDAFRQGQFALIRQLGQIKTRHLWYYPYFLQTFILTKSTP
jgi:hypothetical protein